MSHLKETVICLLIFCKNLVIWYLYFCNTERWPENARLESGRKSPEL